MRLRTPGEVIDKAIQENRVGERILYGLACVFAILGVSILAIGAWNRSTLLGGVGAISTSLCWPAVASARQTRKESVMIRLLEVPLSRPDSARNTAQMLQDLFDRLMLSKKDSVVSAAQAAQELTPKTNE